MPLLESLFRHEHGPDPSPSSEEAAGLNDLAQTVLETDEVGQSTSDAQEACQPGEPQGSTRGARGTGAPFSASAALALVSGATHGYRQPRDGPGDRRDPLWT